MTVRVRPKKVHVYDNNIFHNGILVLRCQLHMNIFQPYQIQPIDLQHVKDSACVFYLTLTYI